MEKERLKETRCVKVIWDVLHSVLIFKIQKVLQKTYYNFHLLKVITKLILNQSWPICWTLSPDMWIKELFVDSYSWKSWQHLGMESLLPHELVYMSVYYM